MKLSDARQEKIDRLHARDCTKRGFAQECAECVEVARRRGDSTKDCEGAVKAQKS